MTIVSGAMTINVLDIAVNMLICGIFTRISGDGSVLSGHFSANHLMNAELSKINGPHSANNGIYSIKYVIFRKCCFRRQPLTATCLTGYHLNPSEVEEWATDWAWLYGSLDPGEYRILKNILEVREAGDYDKYILAAPFTID